MSTVEQWVQWIHWWWWWWWCVFNSPSWVMGTLSMNWKHTLQIITSSSLPARVSVRVGQQQQQQQQQTEHDIAEIQTSEPQTAGLIVLDQPFMCCWSPLDCFRPRPSSLEPQNQRLHSYPGRGRRSPSRSLECWLQLEWGQDSVVWNGPRPQTVGGELW